MGVWIILVMTCSKFISSKLLLLAAILPTLLLYSIIGTDVHRFSRTLGWWFVRAPVVWAPVVGLLWECTCEHKGALIIRVAQLLGRSTLLVALTYISAICGLVMGNQIALWKAGQFLGNSEVFAEQFRAQHGRYPVGEEYPDAQFSDVRPPLVYYKGTNGHCDYGDCLAGGPPIPFEILGQWSIGS